MSPLRAWPPFCLFGVLHRGGRMSPRPPFCFERPRLLHFKKKFPFGNRTWVRSLTKRGSSPLDYRSRWGRSDMTRARPPCFRSRDMNVADFELTVNQKPLIGVQDARHFVQNNLSTELVYPSQTKPNRVFGIRIVLDLQNDTMIVFSLDSLSLTLQHRIEHTLHEFNRRKLVVEALNEHQFLPKRGLKTLKVAFTGLKDFQGRLLDFVRHFLTFFFSRSLG